MELTHLPDGSIRLDVPARYAPALGADGPLLLDWFSSALIALAQLRDSDAQMTPDDLHALINDVEHKLAPRLRGIGNALIRAHAAAGGSYGSLALALDVPKSTAQHRRDKLTSTPPTVDERWVTDGGPRPPAPRYTVRLTLTNGGTDILHGLTDDDARALEMLITRDQHRTATVHSTTGRHTYRADQVQVVGVRPETDPTPAN